MKNLRKIKLDILFKASFLALFIFGLFFSPVSFNKDLSFINSISAREDGDKKSSDCRYKCNQTFMPSDVPGYQKCATACDQAYQDRKDGKEIGTMETALKALVHYVFVLPMVWFATLGVNIAGIVLDPVLMNSIFSTTTADKALYDMWVFIRDILNLLFVFVLLFSAFATIFQIQKYHLLKSNTLVMVILMAILVNFSWPITRVIIDAGNVAMFYLLDALVSNVPAGAPKGNWFFGSLVDGTGIIHMIALDGAEQQALYDKAHVTDQIASGVFLMFYAITFLAIGAIFIVRIAMFVILLIFSSVGFVASIFPGTQKFADMWWDALIKWTIIGPLMVFMVYISTIFIVQMQSISRTMHGFGVSDNRLVGDGIVYSAGIVILWAGILVAQEMGGSAGSFIASKANNMRGKVFRTWKRGAVLTAGGAYLGARKAGRSLDNLTGNKVARFSGNVSGRIQRAKDRFYNDPKQNYEQKRDLASKKAQGGDIAASADKEEQIKYEADLKSASLGAIMEKAKDDNKNDNERKAARSILKQKDIVKSEEDLAKALEILSDSTQDTDALLKNAPKHLIANGSADTYKKLTDSINNTVITGNTPQAISSRKRADKQIAQIRKQFVENGRADIIYDHYIASGQTTQIALKNATSKIKTAEDIAKQTKLLKKANSRNGKPLKNYIKTTFIKSPIQRQELLKNLSSEGLSEVKDIILDQEKKESNIEKINSELEIVQGQIKTLNYANRSTWSTQDTQRYDKLKNRKRSLESRRNTIINNL